MNCLFKVLTLSWGNHGHLAGVRRVAGDPSVGDSGRTVAVLEEAGIGLAFLQHWKSWDQQRHLKRDKILKSDSRHVLNYIKMDLA